MHCLRSAPRYAPVCPARRRGHWIDRPPFLQVNEYVDARDTSMGAWFEAQVVRVLRKTPSPDEPCSSTASSTPEEGIIYRVKYDE